MVLTSSWTCVILNKVAVSTKYCKTDKYHGDSVCENLGIRIHKIHDYQDSKYAELYCTKHRKMVTTISYEHLTKDWRHLDNRNIKSLPECRKDHLKS